MDKINLEDWYTLEEAAKKLGTSKKYIHTLTTQSGQIRTHKLGPHTTLFNRRDIDTYGPVKRGQPGRRRKDEQDA
jgi:excisionase family DNA binding protein